MDKIFSPIKSRIIQFLEYKEITKEIFYEKTNISASNFKGNGAKSELGGDKIAKILTIYNEIDARWLMLGQGEMLRSSAMNEVIKTSNNIATGPCQQCTLRERLLESKEETIGALRALINKSEKI